VACPEHKALFLDVLNQHATRLDTTNSPVLCHDDLNPHNVLFERRANGWTLSAILDFDSAWAGRAESDLARLELWRGMTSPDFWAGYAERAGRVERDPIRTLVLQLLWCLEYARATRAHNADTARICAALGIDPVVFSR
jgi:Ser/Thr protein kinase RdoA (MazF antagonist)